jgi:cell division protein ZapA
MDTLIPVNIIVGDRSYRIRLAPKDEEVVRKIVRIINDKILEFKTQFAGKDMQDYIAMVVLWYATQLKVAGDEPLLPNQIEQKFDYIEGILNKALIKE